MDNGNIVVICLKYLEWNIMVMEKIRNISNNTCMIETGRLSSSFEATTQYITLNSG
jgi:hypothetical protein